MLDANIANRFGVSRKRLDDIEEMLSAQVEGDINTDYLQTLKEISKKKGGDQ
jgi:hypothetical protein